MGRLPQRFEELVSHLLPPWSCLTFSTLFEYRLVMSLSVRIMDVGDLAEVLRIEREVSTDPWDSGRFLDALRAGYICFVAETECTVIGVAIVALVGHGAHLLRLAVAAAWRRKGCGRKLLERCQEAAAVSGATSLSLKVPESNLPAREFYSRCGFELSGRSRGHYPSGDGREDALVLGVRLGQSVRLSGESGAKAAHRC